VCHVSAALARQHAANSLPRSLSCVVGIAVVPQRQYHASHVLLYLENVAMLPEVGRGAGMLAGPAQAALAKGPRPLAAQEVCLLFSSCYAGNGSIVPVDA
jgi:hypothetical protein